MGKIHDALQRAEEERAALGGPESSASPIASEVPDPGADRGEQIRDARRSRIMVSGVESGVTEEFRTLRQRIQSMRRTREIFSIVVTSAVPGEGKTTTATNLALSFGLEPETRTCLVDADLRSPAVHQALHDLPVAGLAEILEADAKLDESLTEVDGTHLSVLPVRALPSYPSELLASRKMIELLDEMRGRFQTVIIDAPPIAGLPDAAALIDVCDAAVLVVGAGQTDRHDVSAALERVDRSKVLGTVFNRCDSRELAYGEYYGRK